MTSSEAVITARLDDKATPGLKQIHNQFTQFSDKINSLTKTSSVTFGNIDKHISQFGRNLQWAGQRLTFALTLPMVLFGKQAIDIALSVNKAFTNLTRVWIGNKDDLDLLAQSAVSLSNKFAITQEEILGLFTELSKAGLAQTAKEMDRLGELALQTASIFDIDLATATNQIKSLMLTFGYSVEDTSKAIDAMNVIADRTAATEEGLIQVLQRAGFVAKPLNFNIRELSATMAILEAANVGVERGATAVRTILQRLTVTSDKAKDMMKAFGVDMYDAGWKSLTGSERLTILARKFKELEQSGDKVQFENFRAALTTLVGGGGRAGYANEFYRVLDDIGNSLSDNTKEQSIWAQALEASSDEMKNAQVTAMQLGVRFDSQEFQVRQLEQKYRNIQAVIGNQLIPVKVKLLEVASKLIDKFNSLSPSTQDNIIKFGVLLAVIGPVITVMGALAQTIGGTITVIKGLSGALMAISGSLKTASTLLGVMSLEATGLKASVLGASSSLAGLAGFLLNPWVLAIAAAVTAIGLAIWWFTKKKNTVDLNKIALENLQKTEENYKNFQGQVIQAEAQVVRQKESLKFAQDQFNEAVKKFGPNSEEAKNKAILLKEEEWRLEEATRKAKEAQEGQNDAVRKFEDAKRQSADPIKWWVDKVDELANKGNAAGQALRSINSAITNAPKTYGPQLSGSLFKHGGGLLHAQTGMIIPGSSPLRDRVPVMAEQGEGIMSKKAIENLLKNGVMGGGQGPTYNINFNPGVMIASPGEQREFARKIKKLLAEDNKRYAQPGAIWTGMTTANTGGM